MDVGNWISDSSAFSKSSLNIWDFSVHILLKPSLKDVEHYFDSMWKECNCAAIWTFLGIAHLGIGMKTDLFHSCGHWIFQICWQIECKHFNSISFRIWNSSAGIPSPPLALCVVMLPNIHLTSFFRMSGSRWVNISLWLSWSLRSFLCSSSVYFCHLFLYFLLLLGPYHFCPLLYLSFHEMFPRYP